MKSKYSLFVILPLILSTLLFTQQAEVTNVVAAQRTDGSGIVDISFDLTEDALFTIFNIYVEVSFDAGNTFTPAQQISGDIASVEYGSNHSIEWNLRSEFGAIFNDDTIVRVFATGNVIINVNELNTEFVPVPAGEFTFGEGDTLLSIDYDFEIMKYEVTNAQYVEFLVEALETEYVWFEGNDFTQVLGYYSGNEYVQSGIYHFFRVRYEISWNGTTFIVEEGFGNHPIREVSFFGAVAFAEYYGLSLPTEQEWEKAARGDTGWDYPWGNSIDGSQANYISSGDPWDYDPIDHGTTPIGFYNGQNFDGFQTVDSPSVFGAYDMAGNLGEYTENWVDEHTLVTRGGSFAEHPDSLRSWYLHIINGGGEPIVGFRCIKRL
jgi:formylglycine-generating enzyme